MTTLFSPAALWCSQNKIEHRVESHGDVRIPCKCGGTLHVHRSGDYWFCLSPKPQPGGPFTGCKAQGHSLEELGKVFRK